MSDTTISGGGTASPSAITQKTSIGRIVHYQSYGTPGGEYLPQPRAAIITHINPDDTSVVSLCVINPTGMFFSQDMPFSETPKPGHWSWPPRL